MPAFLRKNDTPEAFARTLEPVTRARPRTDPFRLRALPHDNVFFYAKRIDNSRLVREENPEARGACWSAIGVAFVMLVLLTSAFAPAAMTTLAGYKLEALHAEARRLAEERRGLDLQEAELLGPARLDRLAHQKNLVTPSSGQLIHLDKPEGAVAMVK
jgi:hypothetical protein